MLGSDYPVGDPDPVGAIDACDFLSAEDKQEIPGGNAGALLGDRMSTS